MKKFAVILSGSGVMDGSEIHEAVMTMLAIRKQGAEYDVFAPDMMQHHVVNHLTGKEMPESRNVLVESARIARGDIKPLALFDAHTFDALVFPGGFGVAKNLCTFAFDADKCKVNHDVEKAVRDMVRLNKPVGALCISPVVLSKILGNIEVTVGDDEGTIVAIKKMGSTHVKTTHGQVVKDHHRAIYSSPCYMLDADIVQIEQGASNLVKAIIDDLK